MGGEGLEIAVAADFHIGSPFSSLPADIAVRASSFWNSVCVNFVRWWAERICPIC